MLLLGLKFIMVQLGSQLKGFPFILSPNFPVPSLKEEDLFRFLGVLPDVLGIQRCLVFFSGISTN